MKENSEVDAEIGGRGRKKKKNKLVGDKGESTRYIEEKMRGML